MANGWQYTSGSLVPDTSKTTVYNIRVSCRYYYNGNTAYFDNISLIKESTPTVYERDADTGYITKVTSDGQTTEITYSGSDIASVKEPDGQETTYQYDAAHFLTSETLIKSSDPESTVPAVNTSYTYDTFGNVTSSTTSVQSQSESKTLYSTAQYSTDGKFRVSDTDENGVFTSYAYNTVTGAVTSVTSRPDATDSTKDIVARTVYSNTNELPVKTYIDSDKDGTPDSGERQINYTYDDNLLLTAISTGNTLYNIEYDGFRNITSVRIYGRSAALASYAYEANNGNLSSVTYANGFVVQNVYDELDRIIAVKYNNIVKYRYTYDGSGRLYSAEDVSENRTSYYAYDLSGNISSVKEAETSTGNVLIVSKNTYDALMRVSSISYTIGADTKSYAFTYNSETGDLQSVSLPDGSTLVYGYDVLDRLVSREIISGNQSVCKEEYTYAVSSGNVTLNRIASIKYNDSTSDMQSYTYDDMGNLLTVSVGGTLKLSYEYDDALQLVRENNAYVTRTYIYEYDLYGNITSKTEYAYAAPGSAPTMELDVVTYTYGNASWGDLLTNYNGTAITYDASGNPNKWLGIGEMLWSGRELYDLHFDDASELSFKYNADGIRTEKKLYNGNGILTETVKYTVDGTKILREYHDLVSGTDYGIDFIYEGGDLPIGFVYDDDSYYYRKNLQGDVISIVNASGTLVVTYTYDAWGQVLSTTGTAASTIGKINPIRYRSYYYDSETGFYYLQSRYYDPTVGRFINADTSDTLSESEHISGANLFLYCYNNSINMFDAGGKKPKYIDNQWDNSVKDLKWGLFGDTGHNGCGWISVYNVMARHSSKITYQSVINGLTSYGGVLGFGKLGANPEGITRYLRSKFWFVFTAGPIRLLWGIKAEISDCVIVLYQHSGMFSPLHYVAGIKVGNGYGGTFNFYNDPYVSCTARLSIWKYVEILRNNGCKPLKLWGVSEKKGWW